MKQTQIEIKVADGQIRLDGQYSEYNNKVWRSLGGKFDRQTGEWVIADRQDARDTIADMFGAKSELVNVVVEDYLLEDVAKGVLQIGGYVVAVRRHRDSAVFLPTGVSLLKGTLPESGGSHKNPRVGLDEDTSFILTCRKSFADARGLAPVEEPAKEDLTEI